MYFILQKNRIPDLIESVQKMAIIITDWRREKLNKAKTDYIQQQWKDISVVWDKLQS